MRYHTHINADLPNAFGNACYLGFYLNASKMYLHILKILHEALCTNVHAKLVIFFC